MPDSSLPGPAMPEDSRTFREILAGHAAARPPAPAPEAATPHALAGEVAPLGSEELARDHMWPAIRAEQAELTGLPGETWDELCAAAKARGPGSLPDGIRRSQIAAARAVIKRLAPAWDALTAELAEAREQLADAADDRDAIAAMLRDVVAAFGRTGVTFPEEVHAALARQLPSIARATLGGGGDER